jgi:hypothetical protein
MVAGTQKANTTTSLSMIWILTLGQTQIFTMTSQDGIIAPLWLKPYLPGNTLFLAVKLEISLKEVLETLDTVPIPHATLILRQCIGPRSTLKMEMLTINPFYLLLESTLLWLMTTKILDF